MAVPITTDPETLFELQFVYSIFGQRCRNIIHIRNQANIPGGGPPDVATAIVLQKLAGAASDFVEPFLDVLAQNVLLIGTSCQPVYPIRYRKVDSELLALPGTVAQDCEVQNVQAAIEKYGPFANRHNIGGVRIGGMATTAYDNGLVTPAHAALLTTLASTWFANTTVTVAGIGYVFEPVIAKHKKVVEDGKDTYPLDGSEVLEGFQVKSEVRTMRSRTIGKGE